MFLPRKGLTMHDTIVSKKGFTLVEIIVVMVLVGIMGTLALMGIMPVVQGMLFTKTNADTLQKGQITMTKLVREFNNINSVVAGSGPASITFTSIKNGSEGTRSVMFSGNKIYYNDTGGTQGDILTDQVSGFKLHYYKINSTADQGTWMSSSRIIEIELTLKGADSVESRFMVRVRPRNIERR